MITLLLVSLAFAGDAVYIGDGLPKQVIIEEPSFLVPESRMDLLLTCSADARTFEIGLTECHRVGKEKLEEANAALVMARDGQEKADVKAREQAALIATLTIKNNRIEQQRNIATVISVSLTGGIIAAVYVASRVP